MGASEAALPTEMVGVVLAAGRGTRMGVLTETTPKPLLPVLGVPALHRVLDGMMSAGIRRFVIVTGYKAEMVRDSLAEYGDGEVGVVCVHQDEQLGTAHAMRLTHDAVGDASVLLAFADIMTSPGNFHAMVRQYEDGHCDLVAAVRDAGDPWRAAAVYLDNEWNIARIIEKPEKGASTTPWSHAGMYCFSNVVYDYIATITPSARGEYEITDAVQMMISDGLKSKAVELTGYWKDLATPEDITAAEVMMQAVNA